MSLYDEWVRYPTGKIAKGSFCKKCGRYNSRNVCGHALAVKDGKVLMIKRGCDPMKGWWALPAGYVDWDESMEECAMRELKEETGLKSEVLELTGVYSDPKRDEDGRQNIGVVYLVSVDGDLDPGEEVEKVKWFDLDKLPEKIAFDHRRMITDYRKRIKTNNYQ